MGNYSKKPQDVLADAQTKNYSRVRFQQGKPILDRELNLLGDLAGTERLARTYIGNGIPEDSDGFKIGGDVASDFSISAGRCLVNGYEVVLEEATTYRTQPHKEHLVSSMPNTAEVYLKVWSREVTDAEDANLENNGDVGFETALREKVDWEVLALEATEAEKARASPDYFLLASITPQSAGMGYVLADERITGLNMSALYNRVGKIVEHDGTLKNGVIGQAQLKLEVVKNGATELHVGESIFEFVAEYQNGEGRIYFPKINNISGFNVTAMGKIEASMVYRPGVSNTVVVELRLTNIGQEFTTVSWSVTALAM